MVVRKLIDLFKPKPNLDPRVFIVSFPRSGHHALVGFLNRVSDAADNYCEFYSCEKHNGEPIECPQKHVNWRVKRNCCGAGKTFLKNHDFDLRLPYRKEDKFVVQYRHPFLSIKSWYEMESGKGKKLEPWPKFFEQKLAFWEDFVRKWVLELGDRDNVLPVTYDSLKDREVILQIAEFSGAGIKPELDKFKPNFREKTRQLESEREFFKERERAIAPLLAQVKIAPLFFDV
jgi:hypothetical protein